MTPEPTLADKLRAMQRRADAAPAADEPPDPRRADRPDDPQDPEEDRMTSTPSPVVTVTSHTPDVYLAPGLGDPDPAMLTQVPEHLHDDYLATVVPAELLTAAVQSKISAADLGDGIVPEFDTKDERAAWFRARSFKPLSVAQVVHTHRLSEAARRHDERQRAAEARQTTACQGCGQQTPPWDLGEIHAPDAGVRTIETMVAMVCPTCRAAWPAVAAQHLADITLRDGRTRGQHLLDLLT